MCSRPFRPLGLPIYVARVPAAPFSPLPIAALPSMSLSQKLHSRSRRVLSRRTPQLQLKLTRYPLSLVATLATLPSMSLFPKAPFVDDLFGVLYGFGVGLAVGPAAGQLRDFDNKTVVLLAPINDQLVTSHEACANAGAGGLMPCSAASSNAPSSAS